MKILFVCTGNSCRSQMAEGWTRELAAGRPDLQITVGSAGLEAHGLNPRAVAAMSRQGVDISRQQSTVLSTAMLESADLTVTVCDHADANCPLLPANREKRHMPFVDPARATGTDAEIDACFDRVCLEIRAAVERLLDEVAVEA